MKGNKITDEYFQIVLEYEEKYGKEKTVVFLEKGSFMELYGLDNDTEKIGNIKELCRFLGIDCTFTDNTKPDTNPGNTRDNPLFGGVPIHVFSKYVNKLLEENYTIVEMKQTEKDVAGRFKREVTSVITKGCYIDDESNTSNIVCIYGEIIEHYQTHQKILTIGLCSIDITTGKSIVYETYDHPNDNNFAINEVYRFIQVSHPKQILICESFEGVKELIPHLELNKNEYIILKQNKHHEKLEYQKQFYKKLFPCNGNVLEYINLARYNLASTSYVYALNFIYERNKTFIDNLKVPIFWKDTCHLVLHHNTVYQLDLYSKDKNKISLCKLLNHCKTKPGIRLFDERLLNPLTKTKSIEQRYECIDTILKHESEISEFTKLLEGVYDIERLFRRLSMEIIQPYALYQIYKSVDNIVKIIRKLKELNITIFTFISFYTEMKRFKEYFETTFILDKLKMCSSLNKDVDYTIFKEGIHPKIDEIIGKHDFVQELHVYMKTLEDSYQKTKRNEGKESFKLKKDKKDYILGITKAQYNQFKKTTTLTDPKYIEFEDSGKSNCRLSNPYIKELNKNIRISSETLNELIIEYYKLHLREMNTLFKQIYYPISKFISNFDVSINNAIISKRFGYSKPSIDTTVDHSYMEISKLRHPIVERIRPEEKYVANDITIGKDQTGIILFGPNAGGKSTTLKALGIIAIMAQSGMYVPCSHLKYSIYKNISSRILGNDDLSKGQSSFEVEMLELNNILRRSDSYSLVLGDEICRGTTTIDALSLVASSIVELSKRNTNFMYTTHLHKLKDLECIKILENVGIYHIQVRIEKDKVIYDRTLQPGNGNTMYGIEIARAMNMNEEFIKQAYSVRDILLNQESFILSQKPSKYNKDIYMGNCEICGEKGEDTHHIGFQCMANENGLIDYYHKNVEHNLVTLCKQCHICIHQYKFKINGWLTTSEGKELDYIKLNDVDRNQYKKEMETKITTTKEDKTLKHKQRTKDILRKKMAKMLEDKENGSFTSIDDYLD